jgi:tetratricopeptide (TPR) repeat protein
MYCRSACYYQLAEYTACLTDIELAVEAGYPTTLVYKLYIRQCKCLLEMCRIPEAQEAFDKAIDAIDRSGLKKDLRKGMATDLQEAFINLAKSVEQDPLLPDATTTKADVSSRLN